MHTMEIMLLFSGVVCFVCFVIVVVVLLLFFCLFVFFKNKTRYFECFVVWFKYIFKENCSQRTSGICISCATFLLPKDPIFRTYLSSLQLVVSAEWQP